MGYVGNIRVLILIEVAVQESFWILIIIHSFNFYTDLIEYREVGVELFLAVIGQDVGCILDRSTVHH